jgi:hypothetical protein
MPEIDNDDLIITLEVSRGSNFRPHRTMITNELLEDDVYSNKRRFNKLIKSLRVVLERNIRELGGINA